MMKKLFSILLTSVIAVMCLSFGASAYQSGSVGIDDQAGLYSSEQITQLEKRQQEVAEHTGWNIAVVTSNTEFRDLDAAIDYAEAYYDKTFGIDSSGILYLVNIDHRHVCISGDADYYYFNDSRVNRMLDDCERCYMDYDDVGNLETFYNYVEKYYDAGPFESANEPYYSSSKKFNVLLAMIAGLIAAGIAILIVYNRYKFHYAPSANHYLNNDKVRFYNRQDRFIREFTTRTRIDSGGSSGGRSHGSSGGHHHGGGSRSGRR